MVNAIIDLSKIVRAAANSVATLLIKLSQYEMRVKLKARRPLIKNAGIIRGHSLTWFTYLEKADDSLKLLGDIRHLPNNTRGRHWPRGLRFQSKAERSLVPSKTHRPLSDRGRIFRAFLLQRRLLDRWRIKVAFCTEHLCTKIRHRFLGFHQYRDL